MRDFNNGGEINVQGDLNFNDNSSSYHKLLINCTSEELLRERPFREENIRLEQSRKIKRMKPFYGLSVILFIAAAGWATFNDKYDIGSFILGSASLLVAYRSFNLTVDLNAFQRGEQDAINEINLLLKQRRVE